MTYTAEVLADSPLAYYRLGEPSGTTMTDSSGNGRNGTYPVAPTLGTTGLAGDADTAITLNGTTQYGQVATAAWMNAASFTLEAIVVPSRVSGAQGLIAHRSVTTISATNTGYTLRMNGTKAEAFLRIGTTTSIVTGLVNLSVGVKYLLTATYNGTTGLFSLYVNGILDNSTTITPGTIGGAAVEMHIGRGYNSGEFYQGVLDEASIYGTVLSAARITAHAAQVPGIATQAQVSREHVEVLHENLPDARVSREHLEVLHQNTPAARVSRLHVEVMYEPSPDVRIHALRPEVLILQSPPTVQVQALRYEVLYSIVDQDFFGTRVTSTETVRRGTITNVVPTQNISGTRVIEIDEVRAGTSVAGDLIRIGVRVTSTEVARTGLRVFGPVDRSGVRVMSIEAARTGTIVIGNLFVPGARIASMESFRSGALVQQASDRVHLEIRNGDSIQRVRLGRRAGSEIEWLSAPL